MLGFNSIKDTMNSNPIRPLRIWTLLLQKALPEKDSSPSNLNSSEALLDNSCMYCGCQGDAESQNPALHEDVPAVLLLCAFCDGTCGKLKIIQPYKWRQLFSQIGRVCT